MRGGVAEGVAVGAEPPYFQASQDGAVAVAMSGGLDSSVAAALVAEAGERVLGLSMLLWDRSGQARNGRCCSALDLGDARRVARQVGIPHYTLRMDREFRERVVDPFVDDYVAGRTPSPCIRCNTWVKFDLLLERARALGADRVATGHYARIVEGVDGPELHQARDRSKDQSYYLFELDSDQLSRARFPLGDKTKSEIRALARKLGLVVAEKGESYEICFVDDSIESFVRDEARARRFDLVTAGAEVVDGAGRPLAERSERTRPYYRYTVGQRRGLGVAAGSRLYVLDVDADRNRITVGSRAELEAPGLLGERTHWIAGSPPESGTITATVKVRSRHDGVEAEIEPLEEGGCRVRFREPVAGVAPGQAAVFYRGTRVLGGCWIRRGVPRSCDLRPSGKSR